MGASIALDAGQRNIKVRLRTETETFLAEFPGLHTAQPLAEQWASVIARTLADHPEVALDEVAVATTPLLRSNAHDLLPLVAPRRGPDAKAQQYRQHTGEPVTNPAHLIPHQFPVQRGAVATASHHPATATGGTLFRVTARDAWPSRPSSAWPCRASC